MIPWVSMLPSLDEVASNRGSLKYVPSSTKARLIVPDTGVCQRW